MRETGLSRNTVRKYLRGGIVKYSHANRDKLDLLDSDDGAVHEIGVMGYSGGISQLKANQQALKVARQPGSEL